MHPNATQPGLSGDKVSRRLSVVEGSAPAAAASAASAPVDPSALICYGLNVEQLLLDERATGDAGHLLNFEAKRFSQFGEDGLIAEIFNRIGTTNRTFIEIGAADGEENCTRALVEEGWSGVWVEGDPVRCRTAAAVVGDRAVRIVEAFVDRDNIVALAQAALPDCAPDLLIVDVDGNDAQILDRCLGALRPRVCVVEYNASIGPVVDWEMPYDPAHTWAESAYHGASLAALDRIARSHGYSLVCCNSEGVNAFFVQAPLARLFTRGGLFDHYVSPRHKMPFGHPVQPAVPFEAAPVPDGECEALRLEVHPPHLWSARAGSSIFLVAVVENGTSVCVGASVRNPVAVAAWWADDSDGTRMDEPARSLQQWRLEPGRRAMLVVRAQVPVAVEAGRHQLWVGLVQEGCRWFDGAGRRAAHGVSLRGRRTAS